MAETDVEQSIELVSVAMNEDEAEWARETMRFYFACEKQGLDSGRQYYVWRYEGEIHGLIGLHRYLWGPRDTVWLSWFAVHPMHHGKDIGSAMMDAIEKIAMQAGYKKIPSRC